MFDNNTMLHMNEIGSEFWNVECTDDINAFSQIENSRWFMTGRTALDFVLNQINKKQKAVSAYVPSYICYSVLRPFIKNNVKIEFYDVVIDNNGIKSSYDFSKKCDIVMLIGYFGFFDDSIRIASKIYKSMGCTVIEDATHSLMSNDFNDENVDWYFAGLRKWSGLTDGGMAICNNGILQNYKTKKCNEMFYELRHKAQCMKSKFMSDDTIEDKSFLRLFEEAETLINNDYEGYEISDDAEYKFIRLNTKYIKAKRCKNAKYLTEKLKGLKYVHTIYSEVEPRDCPLFVPVRTDRDKRAKLRQCLINEKIFCPTHWPLEWDSNALSERALKIYDEELSLVCDQRYTLKDMRRIVDAIYNFEREI